MTKTNTLALLIAMVLISISLFIVIKVQSDFRYENTSVDSLERRGVPVDIVGSKYRYIRVNLLDDSIGECFVSMSKLVSKSDTLKIRIYLNSKGERLYSKIVENE